MNSGVLGGTFDPVHNGHIVVAEETRRLLSLDEVLFIPAGDPWLKAGNSILPAEHRVQMVRLAIAGKPYFKLSTMEIDRAGPTYTVDTISELRSRLGPADELFFILGRDNLAQLPRWREPSRLIEMCRLVVVPRPGYSLPDLRSLEEAIPGISRVLVLLDKPEMDIDSTEIRNRVAQGLSISHLVPKAVDEYIKQHKLYSS
ncbi:MAG: nicotinate-nucleotide adenylyltransferase [Dehalococcoidales bacterium]|nr:nicotinate-nucleotide adenylyltransferase [Dehalococcoidales bacterium]MDZ4230750.1 nicotinate-nucleotide adenylyltransferase [Dehalococcoidales bacterium]